MIIIISAACLILLFFLNKSDEDRKIEKMINQEEMDKLNSLRNNPDLNKKYSKAESVCNEIIYNFPGSSDPVDKKLNFYITRSTKYNIYASGFILDNTRLNTEWFFDTQHNLISLRIEITYNTTFAEKYQNKTTT